MGPTSYGNSPYQSFSAFADYRTIDIQLVNTWSLYSGFGASAKFLTDDFKDWSLAAGARFFAGVNTLFYDGYLELYAQQNFVPTYLKSLDQADRPAAFMTTAKNYSVPASATTAPKAIRTALSTPPPLSHLPILLSFPNNSTLVEPLQ